MKTILFVILFSVTVCESHAQRESSQKSLPSPYSYNGKYMNPNPPACRDISKTTTLDRGSIRVLYALNAVDIDDPESYDDLQRLEIGSHSSKYYSLYVFNRDSTVTAEMEQAKTMFKGRSLPPIDEDNMHITMIINGKFQGWSEYLFSEYFKDFSKNELVEYTRMPSYLSKYNSWYSEPIPTQKWKISDQTMTIVGYLCQKATCTFRGRDYIAWFATDIPINNGPWKFGGLPGLILKVYDNKKEYVFECVKIENHEHKYPITLLDSYEIYQKTDLVKLAKIKKQIQDNYYQMTGLTPTTGRIFPKLYPYNPMERE